LTDSEPAVNGWITDSDDSALLCVVDRVHVSPCHNHLFLCVLLVVDAEVLVLIRIHVLHVCVDIVDHVSLDELLTIATDVRPTGGEVIRVDGRIEQDGQTNKYEGECNRSDNEQLPAFGLTEVLQIRHAVTFTVSVL